MIIDGNQIANEIKNELRVRVSGRNLKLAIIKVGQNKATDIFVERKLRFGKDIGVETEVFALGEDVGENDLCQKISEINKGNVNGIILQLPLPKGVNIQPALDRISPEKDIDALSSTLSGRFIAGETTVLPPVVGAVKIILEKGGININDLKEKTVAIIGCGSLVGRPAALWFMNNGSTVSVLNSHTRDLKRLTTEADIIVSGAGKPGLIKPDMIKEGAIIIDAATAECDGRLVGDADPEVAKKAAVFTPVPGGVGPITVAMVFKNLVDLNSWENEHG
ncbi:bifunctional 5,10-methylenetetrahydrofolate dehydrogenase/5,10-methenyltetrahydrofolate cyclohydrolase [Candidatus Parcubacteria bacterium]|nr:MAG: bifunctional 5,10-methylenetetrahydrofolate dehydrogenase/5,10-methenyltetrahydrofolate cyclohydrolase [Candidatus Parcubacteria bacterium]